MSIRVLLREYPHRSIALVTPSHALIFRHNPSSTDNLPNGSLSILQSTQGRNTLDGAITPKCMVEFSPVDSADLSDYRTLSPMPVHGTLGLITLNNDVFLCVVTGTTKVASARPGETIEKILRVEFHCLNSGEFDNTFSEHLDPYNTEGPDYGQLNRREGIEHPCEELRKLLGNGSFYYSTDFDVTKRLQHRSAETNAFDIDNLDESFLWNSYMISPLVKFRSRLSAHEKEALDSSRILTSAIRGFALTITIPVSSNPLRTTTTGLPATLTLISRLSSRRAGTRFNSRGIDDDGNVANFVESETIYWSPTVVGQNDPATKEMPAGICFSYAQIRGSIPVFWEQAAGLIPGQQKISITRSPEGTQPAFDKHFEDLERNYGAVHIVNLLSETKLGEAELTNLYRQAVRHSTLNQHDIDGTKDRQLLRETEFDFHAETKGPHGYEAASMIRKTIEHSADGFAYYLSEDIEDPNEDNFEKSTRRTVVVLQQEGIFRTNCLDCLDRTNLIQTIISQMAMESFLLHRNERAASDFWSRHSTLWADNGDALSRIYAGTGALKSSFTRSGKMSFAGALADARKSATRLYINNFADKGRQNTIDMLLGRLMGQVPVHLFDPMNDYVQAELAKRSSEFQGSESINIWCGSFNLNGRTKGIDDDLSEWLFPGVSPSQQHPEIVAVGFQEIVELSPQQIMNSDPSQKQAWERAVRKTLNRHAKAAGQEHYVLLRSGQLVGAALCIFVKSSSLRNIKNVEGAIKKTGMSGMAGNKGAVSIRMDYCNTPICFVTAHLAAGFANYEERNRDYTTIHHGLRFQRNRGIDDHDTVIWMGDFNYRIGLGVDIVKNLIKMGDLEKLYENDQLNLQMVAGLTFPFYSESRITFNPTYKYDLGTDTYDTSEKARIPAWTDRILRKGANLRQINYNTAPLRFSDHRPVYATFQCTVSIVDEVLREQLSRQIYEKRQREIGNASAVYLDDSDDDDLIGYDSIEPGLPPASSDKRKWWLDGGQPARSTLQAPNGHILNPDRDSNPFHNDEPDWVTVSRPPPPRARKNANVFPEPFGEPQRTTDSRSATSATTNGTRKLPPPFNPSVSELTRTFSQTSIQSNGPGSKPSYPTRPTERRLSSSASFSSTSSKRPPPVAKKPVHLTSPSLSPAPITNSLSATAKKPVLADTYFPTPPRRTNTEFIKREFEDKRVVATPPPPPQPRRIGSAARSNGVGNDGGGNDRPALPPRRPTVDLLDEDEGSNGLSSWEALSPRRER